MSTVTTQGANTTDKAKEAATAATDAAAQQGAAVAHAASEQVKDVAAHGRTQAAGVAAEAKDQVQNVVGTATTEVEAQLEQRLTDAAGAARTTAGELRALCEGRPQDAGRSGDLARQASERLDHLADRADELGVRGVAEEVTEFARRRPVAFLAGAAVTGLLVGRLARAGREVQSGSPDVTPAPPQVPASTGAAFPTGPTGLVAPADGSVAAAGGPVAAPELLP